MDKKSQIFKQIPVSMIRGTILTPFSDNKNPPFRLPPMSSEQIDAVSKAQNNIIVDSVAGSGKTTTILHLAMAFPQDRILLLTYNKKLKLETRKKIELLGLNNIEAHSYHSCAVKYYDNECYDDYKMMYVVDNVTNINNNKVIRLPSFNRIIIDEAQDMTELYFKFICILIRDLPIDRHYLKFAIIGDKFQSIFAFNGADKRFIQYADVLFAAFTYIQKWLPCKLSTSYRITREMAAFINLVALKNNRLKAVKDGPPVEYIICNTFGQYPSDIVQRIITLTDPYSNQRVYSYDDIFIIAPSVKSIRSPVRKVANYLSAMKIPIFVPGSDEEPLDEDVLRGKVVFSTFHQVKGLERKIVVVFGFDSSYFDYFAKNANKNMCPNTLYVAITRAIEKMYIFHHNGHDFLPFIDQQALMDNNHGDQDIYHHKFVNVTIKDKIHTSSTSRSIQTHINVTDLTRHISAKVICDASQFFEFKEIVPPKDDIEIPIRIDGIGLDKNTLTETVAEINGIALASYFEFISTENMQILNELVKEYSKRKTLNEINGLIIHNYVSHNQIPKFLQMDIKYFTNYQPYTYGGNNDRRMNIQDEHEPEYSFNMTPENLLKLANQYCAFRTEYIYKLNQIPRYDWLSDEHLNAAMERMKGHLSHECNFEVQVETMGTILGKTLNGRIDIFDRKTNTLWEIKAVKSLKREHLIQTVIYGYLFQKLLDSKPEYQAKYFGTFDEKSPEKIIDRNPLKCRCFNILNGQILELSFESSSIEGMLQMIIYAKYFDGRTEADDDFLRELIKTQITHLQPFDPNRIRQALPPLVIKKNNDEKSSINVLDDDFVV